MGGVFSNTLVNAQSVQSTTCSDAYFKSIDTICNTSSHTISTNQNQYWIQFTATYQNIQLNTSLNEIAPLISAVQLLNGNCSSNQIIETDSSFAIGDNITFVSNLVIGQTYFICFQIASNLESKFDACILKNPIEKAIGFGIFYFTDQNGNIIDCPWTSLNYNTNFQNDSVMGAIHSCQELTFCITDTICITMSQTIVGVYTYPETFDFLPVFGLPFATTTFNSDFSEACITFNATGTSTVYLDPNYSPTSDPFANGYSYVGGAINQWVWNGSVQSYMNINVVDQTPPATSNSQNALCVGENYTLEAYGATTLTEVIVNNVQIINPNSNTWSTSFNTPGQYTIEYTVDGLCQPVTYFDTVIVIDSLDFSYYIDPCNNISFSLSSCQFFSNVDIIFSNGVVENIQNFTGDSTWTYSFPNLVNPIIWLFQGWQSSISPPFSQVITFSQSGIIQPLSPQPITLSAPSYLCEMDTISITSPTNLTSIVWSTSNPLIGISGQGTTAITLIGTPANGDLMVYVSGADLNGCIYLDSVLIIACCMPDTSGTEFFERPYTTIGTSSISNQLPASYYNGSTNPIVIDLPTPPAYINQFSTPFSIPMTISDFIALNPSVIFLGNINTINWIFFNNDIIIDTNITFLNCFFIRFAPGAKMIVQPGKTTTMSRCTLAPRCEEMWGGIEMADYSEFVNLAGVTIIGAENGISSVNGGRYQVTNSRFIDNYIGISVKSYLTSNTLSVIENSYFGDVTGQNLLSPYQTEPQPLHGIFIQNILDIVVGPNTTANGNLFHNHQRGITSIRSSVHSYKNNFHNIRHAVGALNEGDKFAAIFADNSTVFFPPSPSLNHKLWVGGSADNRNNFVNCEFGISSKKSMNLDARWNFMKNCALRGISTEENPKKRMDIYNNEINSINSNAWGIYVKNYSSGIVNVYYNQINTTTFVGPFGSINRFAAGIYISSVTPTVVQTTNVVSNTVQNCLYGIWMINTMNGVIDGNTVNMNFTNSTINALSSSYAPIRGILVQNSTKAQIRSNIVTRNMGTGIGVINNNLQGIRLELSPASNVWNNRMYNTAVGFYARGTSLGSRVDCNKMYNTRNGFYMDLADLSDQGAPVGFAPYLDGYDAHNQWYNTFSDRTDGTMGAPNQYYHGISGVLDSEPNPLLTPVWIDNTLVSSSPYTTCVLALNSPIVIETPISKRTREILPIAQNNFQYDTLDYQQKHYLQLAGYSRLENDSNLLIMNVPEDSIYVNYLQENVTLNTQSKIVHDAQKAIAENNYSSALTSCSQISASCVQYNTNKIVQELWIDRKSNSLELSSADTLFLKNIACLDPIEFGSGVYQARAMIDWDGFCFSQNRSTNQEDDEFTEKMMQSKVYPNPSEGKIQFESSLSIERVIILDLKGSALQSYSINDNYEIDTQLSTGIYLIQVVLENGIVETHKLYIN